MSKRSLLVVSFALGCACAGRREDGAAVPSADASESAPRGRRTPERGPAPMPPCETEPSCTDQCIAGSPSDCDRLTALVDQRCAAPGARESGVVECLLAVEAGQMTEECALGRRLFDAERWKEAVLVLRRVVSGDTGDDTGNQQYAETLLAIALHHDGVLGESRSRFAAILRRRGHLGYERARKYVDSGVLSR